MANVAEFKRNNIILFRWIYSFSLIYVCKFISLYRRRLFYYDTGKITAFKLCYLSREEPGETKQLHWRLLGINFVFTQHQLHWVKRNQTCGNPGMMNLIFPWISIIKIFSWSCGENLLELEAGNSAELRRKARKRIGGLGKLDGSSIVSFYPSYFCLDSLLLIWFCLGSILALFWF